MKRIKLRDITNKVNKVLETYGEPEKCVFVEDEDLVDLGDEEEDIFPNLQIEIKK